MLETFQFEINAVLLKFLPKNPEKIRKLQILKYATKYYDKKYFWPVNQCIIMISNRSCDIEDWSNDAENSALINYV